jgi:regulator of replication initiation timing
MFVNQLSQDPRWKVSELNDGLKRLLRVPVAVIGEWKHPEYGDLTFSQQDFDEIISNWEANVLGYEPPLHIGHSTDITTFGGQPAIAFQTSLLQEEDVLFGIYEPVSDEVLDSTKNFYRYSSSETLRNAKSKKTGDHIGTVLTGMALTNTPFLTGLPRVEVVEQYLSEVPSSDIVSFIFLQNQEPPMADVSPAASTTTDPSTEPLASSAAGVKEVAEQFSKLAAQNEHLHKVNEDLLENNARLEAELEASKVKLSELSVSVNTILERSNKQDLSDKLRRISRLNLPEAVKADFGQKLSEGFFSPEQEEFQFNQMQVLSDTNKSMFTRAQGHTNPANSQVPLQDNPYAKQIQLNLKLAESRRQSSLV